MNDVDMGRVFGGYLEWAREVAQEKRRRLREEAVYYCTSSSTLLSPQRPCSSLYEALSVVACGYASEGKPSLRQRSHST